MRLHVNWGHASAQQMRRASVDSDWEKIHFANLADAVLGQGEARRAFGAAPPTRIEGTSTVSMSSEQLHVDPLFLDGIVALRATDVFSK